MAWFEVNVAINMVICIEADDEIEAIEYAGESVFVGYDKIINQPILLEGAEIKKSKDHADKICGK